MLHMANDKKNPRPAPKNVPSSRTPVSGSVSTPVRNTPIPKPQSTGTPRREVTQDMIARRAYELWQSGKGGSAQPGRLASGRARRPWFSAAMAQVAFIGLGKMGRPMAARIQQAGHQVHAFNRSRGAIDELSAMGATPARSAAEAAAPAEVILTALPTPDSVATVYEELARAARGGQAYVDCSTVSLDLNRRCAASLAKRGARFLDAPVSGGPAGAQAGTLTVMVGGEQAAFDVALPIFRSFGKNIRLCGGVGAGQAVKLVLQLHLRQRTG
jgi:hypothetical protein